MDQSKKSSQRQVASPCVCLIETCCYQSTTYLSRKNSLWKQRQDGKDKDNLKQTLKDCWWIARLRMSIPELTTSGAEINDGDTGEREELRRTHRRGRPMKRFTYDTLGHPSYRQWSADVNVLTPSHPLTVTHSFIPVTAMLPLVLHTRTLGHTVDTDRKCQEMFF